VHVQHFAQKLHNFITKPKNRAGKKVLLERLRSLLLESGAITWPK
jgi:hypothetical protein